MEKYEVDTVAKTAELAQLKTDKEKDFRALQELARTYDDYEVSLKQLSVRLNLTKEKFNQP